MQDRTSMYSANALKLGLFGANCSSGRVPTLVDERWSGDWQDCLRLAQIADEAGMEFLLPIGRWKGYGGTIDYQGATLETVTWATGLLAKTKRITVFGTVHAPLLHPIIAAKEFVTADHVSEGRFGLNIVCGWNEDEFEMFGVSQRDHESRYDYAQEWIDAIKRMWDGPDEFDFDGNFIKLKKVRAFPKPYGGSRPIIMNAGTSATGQGFAIRNCDALFTGMKRGSQAETRDNVARIKGLARQQGRDIDLYTVGIVTCRPSRKDAEEYHRHSIIEKADWPAIDNLLAMRNITRDHYSDAEFEQIRKGQANGLGGLPLVGTPDDVAKGLAELSEIGLRGIAAAFVNYADELPYFCAEVLPRLERLGVRQKS
jgi:alkanesulfonate monooxygenase SsuD/methylene tetrahydromethanopterin reductase-like flavin-dependent oxidoreductase (luciferase family)